MSAPLDKVDAFLVAVRAVEAEWSSELVRRQRGFVFGASPWDRRSALLEEIKAQHGFSPDHMLVRSITAYLREQERLDAERLAERKTRSWPVPENHPDFTEYCERDLWFEFLHACCRARNIPRVSATGADARTQSELWAHIAFCQLPARRALGRGQCDRSRLCPEDVLRVYEAMQRLGLDTPRPPFPLFTDADAEFELRRIAIELERADRERYDAVLAKEKEKADQMPTEPRIASVSDIISARSEYDPCEKLPQTFDELTSWVASQAAAAQSYRRGGPPVTDTDDDHHYLESFCEDAFGSTGVEPLRRLRARYVVQTGKTIEQVNATTLREMANHFRAQTIGNREDEKGTGPIQGTNGGAVQPMAALISAIQSLHAARDSTGESGTEVQDPDDTLPWPEYMTANDLAKRLRLPPESTRKKLERLADRIDCRREVEGPRKGESRWTYRTQSVLPELRGG